MDSKSLCYAKSPIPVFNSSSPPNYVIMPALLAHVDHTCNAIISPTSPKTTSTSHCLASNKTFNNFKIHVPTCSKEIIYKSKRSRQNMLPENNSNNSELVHTNLRMENNTEATLNTSVSHLQSPYSMPFAQPTKTVYKIKNIKSNNRLIKNLLNNNFVKSKSPKLKTTNFNNFTGFLSNDNFDPYELSSLSSTPSLASNEEDLIEKNYTELIHNSSKSDASISSDNMSNSFISDSFINNDLSEQRNQDHELNSRNLINFENSINHSNDMPYHSNNVLNEQTDSNNKIENQPKLPYNANRSEEIQTNETYTITYPSEMQSNVNRMINCFVALKKIENKTISAYETENTIETECHYIGVSSKNKIKLKCGVCCLEFNDFDHLLEHKEQNLSCKNDVQIFDENSLIVKKSKRKKKDLSLLLSNHQNKFGPSSDFKRTSSKKNYTKTFKDVNNNNYYRDEDLDDDDGQMTRSKDNGVKVLNLFKNSINNNHFFSENDTNNTADSSTMNENEENYSDLDDDNCAFKSNEDENHNDDDKIIDDEDEFEKRVNPKIRRPYMRQKSGSSNNLTCEKCNKGCRTKAELLVHMHKHSGNEPNCWECGKKCASFSNLISHIQLHTGEKPFTCQFCGKQFTQDAHLTRHIRLHTGERPFICSLCGKTYKDYSYYKTHLRIHRGERLYKCNYCDKEYYDASYYKKHTRLHTGEKPYMCTVCGKQFHRSDYLKLHSYSHTSERPFTCQFCGKGFKMNYNLKLHLKSHDVNVGLIGEEKDDEFFANSSNNNNFSMLTYNNENIEQTNYNFNFLNSADKNISNHSNNLINLNLNHPKINSITSIAAAVSASNDSSNDLHDIIKMLDST